MDAYSLRLAVPSNHHHSIPRLELQLPHQCRATFVEMGAASLTRVTLVPYGIVETVAQFFEKEPKTFMQRMDHYKRKWPPSNSFLDPRPYRSCGLYVRHRRDFHQHASFAARVLLQRSMVRLFTTHILNYILARRNSYPPIHIINIKIIYSDVN